MEKPKGNRRTDKSSGKRPSGDRRRTSGDRRGNEKSNSRSGQNWKSDSKPDNVRKDWGSVTRHGAGKLTREESEDREERNKRTATRTPEDEIVATESSDRIRNEATEAISRAKGRKKNVQREGAKKRVPTPNIPHQLPDAGKLLSKILGEKRGARAS